MVNPLQLVGANILRLFESIGQITLFLIYSLWACITPPFHLKNLGRQIVDIGFYSLPVVGLTAIFSGMVLALQSYTGFSRFSAEGAIASVVALSITRELGPVLAGLMVAGRVGAAIAAEVSSMKVTEQIDALTTLSANPINYLVAPRLWAATLTLPLLVLVADSIGILGGYIIAVYQLDFNAAGYVSNTIDILEPLDIISGLVKAAAFGFVIALMGCYHGFNSGRGAQGVGAATTHAVVSASILILVLNFVITALFFGV